MINGFTAKQYANQTTCEVCDGEIPYLNILAIKDIGYPVCSSVDCQQVMKQKSCMTPLLFKPYFDFNRKRIHRRKEKDAASKKRIDALIAKETQEHREILQTVLEDFPELSENTTHIVVIPSGNSTLLPPDNERIEKYTEHLKAIISEACDYNDASEVIHDEHHDAYGKRLVVEQRFSETPDLQSISDQLCCMCKGGCCASGKEHAYLSVFSIRRFMDENPDLSPEIILDFYLSNICTNSIEESCINHTETGCALPRELRSDICNGFYCESIKAYQKNMAGKNNLEVVVAIQRSSVYWKRFDSGVCDKVVDVALM